MDIQGLKQYVNACIARIGYGGAAEIARKCDIASSTLSQFLSGKYGAKEETLAVTIATALNYYENSWNVVDSVTSYRQVYTAFMAAKKRSIWMCISSRSGSGKTQSLIDLYNTSKDNSVIYLKCRKWTARKFLTKLATAMGVKVNRYMDNDDLLDAIAGCANQLGDKKPVLLLDDAGKLTHSAMQMLIPLYDDTLHRMGAIVAGTETLERNIKRYVGKIEGYDEIDGRFGRNYISLMGATKKDVLAICAANGIADAEERESIWGNMAKVQKEIPGKAKQVWFADDLRELSRMIEDKLIREQIQKGELL